MSIKFDGSTAPPAGRREGVQLETGQMEEEERGRRREGERGGRGEREREEEKEEEEKEEEEKEEEEEKDEDEGGGGRRGEEKKDEEEKQEEEGEEEEEEKEEFPARFLSIERILSPQLGPRPPLLSLLSPDGYLQGLPGGFTLDSGHPRPPVPVQVPVPVPGCLQYRGLDFGEPFYPCGVYLPPDSAGQFQLHLEPDPSLGNQLLKLVHLRPDSRQVSGFHGYQQGGVPCAQAQLLRQKPRMRTVFTDGQTKRLEALFALTDYPAVEARAELARSAGLSEETVRVWFKNRRARRKRQRSGSKVTPPSPPSPPPPGGAETRVFASVL
ncbi:uncharacterized protein V6R79_016470 [Siganus canaliculatus]